MEPTEERPKTKGNKSVDRGAANQKENGFSKPNKQEEKQKDHRVEGEERPGNGAKKGEKKAVQQWNIVGYHCPAVAFGSGALLEREASVHVEAIQRALDA
jgi:hypothetical protein